MTSRSYRVPIRFLSLFLACAIYAVALPGTAQTPLKLHSNKYKPEDDVQIGRQGAAEVEKQTQVFNDRYTTDYVADVGRRLVEAIPQEFQQSGFDYTFKVVNAKEINAFALPGGPMYVNRGMIEAAKTEGEMAGVMAHEISHVALRHGTAQATKAQKYEMLSGIGQIAGSMLGGPAAAVGQMASQGIGVYMLKFSREYEKEADLLGARIMANAGYDPVDLANMFRTIEQQGGSGGTPQFLSSHPNPENRYGSIQQEAKLLTVSREPIKVTPGFTRAQARLSGKVPASANDVYTPGGGNQGNSIKNGGNASGSAVGNAVGNAGGSADGDVFGTGESNSYAKRVAAPSAKLRSVNASDLLSLSVPENWEQLAGEGSVTFAPEGAYGSDGITHGVMTGVEQTSSAQLEAATKEYIRSLLSQEGNSYLVRNPTVQRTTVDGLAALATTLTGKSPITGNPEMVKVITALLGNGQLLYFVAVVPQAEAAVYGPTFQSMLRSVKLKD